MTIHYIIPILLSLIFLTSIWCMGITIITQEGMALYKLREWGDEKHDQGHRWVEPLFLCHWCMPSIHSAVGYLFAYVIGIISSLTTELLFMYPIVVMGSSLLNGIIWGFHKYLERKTEYYKYINESFKKMDEEKKEE